MTKYKPGTKIGIKETLFIKEIEPYISNNGKTKKRQGIFQCPVCGNNFEARIDYVTKKTFKGCPKCSRKMINTEDLSGQRFGKLIVLSPTNKRRGTGIIWKCKCDCGNISYPNTQSLKSGHAKSCGCLQKEILSEKTTKNLAGLTFGKIKVIEKTEIRKNKSVVWKCQCECGNICYIKGSDLINGRVTSCGCLKSKGELKITNLLIDNNIVFNSQWKGLINNLCVNPETNYPLRFDFYLPDYNCCIEYDGKQHFEYYNNGFFNKENYDLIILRDKIKEEYCKNNNIKLIRIPYTDFNILDIQYILEKIHNA